MQVGADGYVYVGRGWNWANTYANNSLAITFMGDYGRYEPEKKQIEATQYLLAHALTNKYIDLNYKLVAQNQVLFHLFLSSFLDFRHYKIIE